MKRIHATRQPLVFHTENLGQPRDVTLEPFSRVAHQRYSVYRGLFSPAAWKQPAEQKSAAAN